MVQQLVDKRLTVTDAAHAYGVTGATVRKWLSRFLAPCEAGLADASSRLALSPRAIAPGKALAIVESRLAKSAGAVAASAEWGPKIIVVLSLVFELVLRVCQRHEPSRVQTLIA